MLSSFSPINKKFSPIIRLNRVLFSLFYNRPTMPATYSFEGHSPSEAAQLVTENLNLNPIEKMLVFNVLNETTEDPILVIRLNQAWIAQFGLPLAIQVLDAIATFNMAPGQRRDDQARHLCFHFAESLHIYNCRLAILANPVFRNAFCPSPTAIADLNALNVNYPGNIEPMGFCAQVNKIGIRRDDIQPFDFFYR